MFASSTICICEYIIRGTHHSSLIIHHSLSISIKTWAMRHLPRTALIGCRSGSLRLPLPGVVAAAAAAVGVNFSFLSVGDRVATTFTQRGRERETERRWLPTVVYFRLFTVNCGSAAVNRMLRLVTWHKTGVRWGRGSWLPGLLPNGLLGAYQLQTDGSQLCHAVCLFAVSIVT